MMNCAPRRRFSYLALMLLMYPAAQGPLLAAAKAEREAKAQPFTIDDYFRLRRITELSLSSDGKMIAYVTEQQSLEQNKTVRQVFVGPVASAAHHVTPSDIQDARNLAWVAGRHELAFLSGRSGSAQVHVHDVTAKTTRPRTAQTDPVMLFRFAPDGERLAIITREAPKQSKTLYHMLQEGDQGVRIDPDRTYIYHFINPYWPTSGLGPARSLVIQGTGNSPLAVDVPGSVQDLRWSPTGAQISVNYVSDRMPNRIDAKDWWSLGLVDAGTGRFSELANARAPSSGTKVVYYAGGEWSAEGDKLLVRRVTETNRWHDRFEWAVADVGGKSELRDADHRWNATPEIEAEGSANTFIPANDGGVFVEANVKATRSLFELTPSSLTPARFLGGIEGSTALVQFSADFEQAVFVNQSMNRPPEIYACAKPRSCRQLTRLNAPIARLALPRAKEIVWKSDDGIMVHGWLLEPVGTQTRKPWPLVTQIHGGPGLPFRNEFAFYFPSWPYPLEVYAQRGIAVFMPNYRGTGSFGASYAAPARPDGEPIDDIVSGIKHLVATGVANPDKLGISGQSHGAWLASLTMTRARMFRAGSFAEGTGNKVVNYSLMSGDLNKYVHDVIKGVSLYDDPQYYISQSPDLHFKGLDTAVLFEAGNRSLAINMLGFPKAAQRAGMPTEYFVYPNTGHGIESPRLQKDSATRNLNWFLSWLDPDDREPDRKSKKPGGS